jgi:glycosyltransferase involved in cell wall biosynthesis
LLHYYAATKSKIVITPEAVGKELFALAKNRTAQKRHEKELLYVGSLYPHKNLSLVLKALARQLTDYTLVVVGSRSVFRMAVEQQVADLNIADRVTFEGTLSDEVLAKHYQEATALVQPSFSEGFGLTGLEAMSFQTPVVASNIPVFKEVYQNAAVYFDPKSVSDFSAAMKKLENPTVFRELTESAVSVSRQYDWQTLADSTYSEYQDVISS